MAVIYFEGEKVVWGHVGGENSGNVVLGDGALPAATPAEAFLVTNTAIGAGALKALKGIASGNVAVGASAMGEGTTAIGNVAVGQNALGVNKTGTSNVAIGESAMQAGEGGEETIGNVAIGASSLFNAVGKNNVAIGVGALFENKSGNRNVAIGQEAGEFELGSNKLYIANSNTETPLIKGDFSAETLLIHGQLTATVGSLTKLGTPMRELAQL